MTSLVHQYPSVKRSSPKKWADVSSMIIVCVMDLTYIKLNW